MNQFLHNLLALQQAQLQNKLCLQAKSLGQKSEAVNSTIGAERPILAGQRLTLINQVRRPLLITKPTVTTLSKALTPDFTKSHIHDSALTSKESEQSPKCYTILSANDQKTEEAKNKAAKLGRWTPAEKQKFIDGLKIYGKDWKRVEKFIGTRSGAQIRSHAQKFFIQVERTKGMDIDEYIKQLKFEYPEFEKKRNAKKSEESHEMQRRLSTNSEETADIVPPPKTLDSEKLSKFVEALKNQIQVNNAKKVTKINNSEQIENLEKQRQMLHFEFLTNMNSKMLMVDEKESDDFIKEYHLKFQQNQSEFLKLLNSEMQYYESQGASKDLVNSNILKNLIEILNVQILLKLAQKKQNPQILRMKNAAPIDLRVFIQLIPETYGKNLNSKLGKRSAEIIEKI